METTKYYHKNSDVVAFERVKDSDGYWNECTYDHKGNQLTYKNSNGFSCESTYDDNGNQLTFKNSNGYFEIKGEEVTEQAFENRVEYNMTNNEIITALENLILLAGSTDNIYMQNKLSNIKNALVDQWNENDLYYDKIKEILNTEETMNNLNDLTRC